ncbi:MAG: hypothetical protein CVV64_16465 [Candidatus Wallbacteria bacterium HGW-Wallbacteria-1]|jgi:hypothetical protein|uniref:LTD domain-containing protein n=1 Tax=Candidatus Wallbacteria bacterium HGW-Wallbacteria-1 TaxID=2013854 RepID=A0A2N1PKS9_9BACT|nr:MAG: hypothetical protein CVV64_16465 [Candidatus Wallbacteria bacterium HGW-Wallbacteria-1]
MRVSTGTKILTLVAGIILTFALSAAARFSPAMAGEFRDWLKTSNGEHYQQPEYAPVDPKGDAYLIRKIDQVPMKLVNALIKKDYREEDIKKEEETRKEFEIGRSRSIEPDRMVNKFREIIQDLPEIELTRGKEHEWCPEAEKYMLYGFWDRLGRFATGKQKDFPAPLLLRSKLFLLLACGWTSRYAVTGQEKALEDWILSRPDRSLLYHDLFRESYILNKGDMYLSILTCENVLAGDPYVENRAAQPAQMKLRYIRNDSRQLGDNYGAWYHFYGLMLYGIVRPGLVTRFVAETESLGSFFLEGADKQEDYINRVGAIFSKKLSKMVTDRTWMIPLGDDDRTDYLTQDEFDHSDPFKADILITEIVPGGSNAFVELYCRDDRNSGQGVDMGGVTLVTSGKGAVVIPAGTMLKTGQYMVIAPTASTLDTPSQAVLLKSAMPELSAGDCFAALLTPGGAIIDSLAWADGNGSWFFHGSSSFSGVDSALGNELSSLYNMSGWVSPDEVSAVRYTQAGADGQPFTRAIARPIEMKDTNSMLDWSLRDTMTPGAASDFSFRRRDDRLFAEAFERQNRALDKSVSDYVEFARAEKADGKIFINFSGKAADSERVKLSVDLNETMASAATSSASVSSISASRGTGFQKALAQAKSHEENLRREFYDTSFFNFVKKSRLLGQIKVAKQHLSIISRLDRLNQRGPDRAAVASGLDYGKLSTTSMGSVLADSKLVDRVESNHVLDVRTGKPANVSLQVGTTSGAQQALLDFLGNPGSASDDVAEGQPSGTTGEAIAVDENDPLLNGDDPRVRKLGRLKGDLQVLQNRYQETLRDGHMDAANALLQGPVSQLAEAIAALEDDIRNKPWADEPDDNGQN